MERLKPPLYPTSQKSYTKLLLGVSLVDEMGRDVRRSGRVLEPSTSNTARPLLDAAAGAKRPPSSLSDPEWIQQNKSNPNHEEYRDYEETLAQTERLYHRRRLAEG